MVSNMNKVAKELKNAINASDERKPKPYDTQAEVVRIEDKTAWVHIPGGVEETPVRLTINAKEGDMVNIHVANGSAWITGNGTNPPTDDTRAEEVYMAAGQSIDFVAQLVDKEVTVKSITAATGYIDDLYSKNIYTENISAATGYINDLESNHITVNDLVADHATVEDLDVTYAKIQELDAAEGRIDNLEANEVVVNDTLRATNAHVEYLESDWISTDRLVLTGNNKNNYPPVEITEAEFNVNKTAYWTKSGDTYTQCTSSSVYDPDEQYYVRQTVKSIIEAINTANNTDPQVVVSNDKLIAASMDVAELSAITADMGTLTAGKIQKGNNFINLNTSPASMEFKNASTWANATQGLQFDTQGNLNIKGTVTITAGSNVPTIADMGDAINGIQVGGRNLLRAFPYVSDQTITRVTYEYDGDIGQYKLKVTETGDNFKQITTHDAVSNISSVLGKTVILSAQQITSTRSSADPRVYLYGRKTDNSNWNSSTSLTKDILTRSITIPNDLLTLGYLIRCDQSQADVVNDVATFTGIKLEIGNKATDWTPAPEDVQAEIDAKKNTRVLKSGNTAGSTYSTIIGYAADGAVNNFTIDNTDSNFNTVSDVKVGDSIRLAYKVNNFTGTPWVYIIGTATEIPNATHVRIRAHGLDTTIIDGGNILTNSIGANQIAANSIGAKHISISDTTNLATANELYESSLPTNLSAAYLASISNGYLIKQTATQQYLMVTDYTPNAFKTDDELYYEFYGKAATAGTIRLSVWGYDGASGSPSNSISNAVEISFTTADSFYSGTISLSNANWGSKTQYLIGFSDPRTTKSQIYIRKLIVRRKNGGELIVDGSITTNHLAANSITVGKMNQDAKDQTLNSNVLIGGRNLLLNTARPRTSPASAQDSGGVGSAYVTPGETLTDYGLSITNTTSTKFTYSFDYTVTGNSAADAYIYVQMKGSQASGPVYAHNVKDNPTGHFTHTFKLTSTQASSTSKTCGIRLRNATDGAVLTVSNAKLEVGNKETDWSPAPEDVINDNILVDSKKMGNWVCGSEGARTEGTEFAYVTLNCSDTTYSGSISTRPMLNPSTLNGTPLTISFDYTASVDTSIGIGVYGSSQPEGYTGDPNSQTIYRNTIKTLPASSSYTRYSTTLAVLTSADLTGGSGDFNSLYFRFYTRTVGSVVRLRRIKIEYGSYATAWCESSKDYKTYITRIDDAGIRIHPSITENDSVVIDSTGMEIFKGGTEPANSVAKYGNTARIGKENTRHVEIKDGGMQVLSDSSTELANLGFGSGKSISGTTVAPYYTLGKRKSGSTIGNYSVAEGYNTTASHVEAHAEGYNTTASGTYAHAEGRDSVASGDVSHAEGSGTTASNDRAHAEGNGTTASGYASHAEGYYTVASGSESHASGYYTIAKGSSQVALGNYNVGDTTSVIIIGNGTADDARSNALTVSKAGTVNIASSQSYKVNGTIVASARAKTTITPTASGVSNYSTYGNSYYEKAGNVVHVHVGVKGVTANTVVAIATLPSGYRPTSIVFGHGTGGTSDNIGYMDISTAGVIQVRSSTGYVGADVTYFV